MALRLRTRIRGLLRLPIYLNWENVSCLDVFSSIPISGLNMPCFLGDVLRSVHGNGGGAVHEQWDSKGRVFVHVQDLAYRFLREFESHDCSRITVVLGFGSRLRDRIGLSLVRISVCTVGKRDKGRIEGLEVEILHFLQHLVNRRVFDFVVVYQGLWWMAPEMLEQMKGRLEVGPSWLRDKST